MDIAIEAYNSRIVPLFTYAAEVTSIAADEIKKLEKLRITFLKKILNCCKSTSTAFILLELNQIPIHALIEIRLLSYYYRIKQMEERSLTKEVHNHYKSTSKWFQSVQNTMKKYNLPEITKQTKQEWNNLIKSKIMSKCRNNQLKEIQTQSQPSHLLSICTTTLPTPGILTYAKLTHSRNIFRLRSGNNALYNHQQRYLKVDKEDRRCPLCWTENENESHFLLRCQYYDHERRQLITTLIQQSQQFLAPQELENLKSQLTNDKYMIQLLLFEARYPLEARKFRDNWEITIPKHINNLFKIRTKLLH